MHIHERMKEKSFYYLRIPVKEERGSGKGCVACINHVSGKSCYVLLPYRRGENHASSWIVGSCFFEKIEVL